VQEDLFQMLTLLASFHRNLHAEAVQNPMKKEINYQRFTILSCLNLFPEHSMKELSRLLGVSSSSLSIIIDSLKKEDVVARKTDPGDRRRVMLELTPKGNELLERCKKQVIRKLKNWTGRIKREDLRELEKAISVVNEIFLENPVSPEGSIALRRPVLIKDKGTTK